MPESLAFLGVNIAQKIRAEGVPFFQIYMHIGSKRMLSVDFSEKVEKEEVMIGLPQNRTEEIIRDELALYGLKIRYACALKDIKTTSEYIEAYLGESGEPQRYDWAIGCDGIDSTTRKKMGIEYPGIEEEKLWSVADVEIISEEPLRSFFAWIKLPPNNDAVVALPIGERRLRIISSTTNGLETLPVPIKIKKIRRQGTFKIKVAQAETYQKERVLLAGDAAHCHSPVGGKGMNLGMGDAITAARAIIANDVTTYTSDRHKIGKQVVRQTEFMRKRIMSKNVFVKVFMGFVMRTISRSSYLQKIAIKQISQL